MAQLKPALDFAWPERPAELGDLPSFLEEALDRFQAKSEEITGDEGLVPAASLAGTENVDERLLPDWWRGWFQQYRGDVAA
jgi:hypothetical protein